MVKVDLRELELAYEELSGMKRQLERISLEMQDIKFGMLRSFSGIEEVMHHIEICVEGQKQEVYQMSRMMRVIENVYRIYNDYERKIEAYADEPYQEELSELTSCLDLGPVFLMIGSPGQNE